MAAVTSAATCWILLTFSASVLIFPFTNFLYCKRFCLMTGSVALSYSATLRSKSINWARNLMARVIYSSGGSAVAGVESTDVVVVVVVGVVLGREDGEDDVNDGVVDADLDEADIPVLDGDEDKDHWFVGPGWFSGGGGSCPNGIVGADNDAANCASVPIASGSADSR